MKDEMTLCLHHTKHMELWKQVQTRATNLIRRMVHVSCEKKGEKIWAVQPGEQIV